MSLKSPEFWGFVIFQYTSDVINDIVHQLAMAISSAEGLADGVCYAQSQLKLSHLKLKDADVNTCHN